MDSSSDLVARVRRELGLTSNSEPTNDVLFERLDYVTESLDEYLRENGVRLVEGEEPAEYSVARSSYYRLSVAVLVDPRLSRLPRRYFPVSRAIRESYPNRDYTYWRDSMKQNLSFLISRYG
jgi:hypothetical protein